MVISWDEVGEANRKQNQFVDAYLLAHFGEHPVDPEQAQSDALTAFWESEGLVFSADDDETFILPDSGTYAESSETLISDNEEADSPFVMVDRPPSYEVIPTK